MPIVQPVVGVSGRGRGSPGLLPRGSKALLKTITHKVDVGGVRLNLGREAAVRPRSSCLCLWAAVPLECRHLAYLVAIT